MNATMTKEDELVQYFVVNSELNMSAGKIAAQVGHVATDIAHEFGFMAHAFGSEAFNDIKEKRLRNFFKWYSHNQTKIILRGKQKDLEKLIQHGAYYILDIGRTEVTSGSLTCVGFTPECKSVMHPIVKRFQLL